MAVVNYWAIAGLIVVGAIIGFVLSGKLTSRYYMGVGMALTMLVMGQAAQETNVYETYVDLAAKARQKLSDKKDFRLMLSIARAAAKEALFSK